MHSNPDIDTIASNVVGFLRQAGRTLTSRRVGRFYFLTHWTVYNNLAESSGSDFPIVNSELRSKYSSLCSLLLCPRLSTRCLESESAVVSVSRYWHRCLCPHGGLSHSPSQWKGPQHLCPFVTLRSSSTGNRQVNPALEADSVAR
jgi:hypothetical protein